MRIVRQLGRSLLLVAALGLALGTGFLASAALGTGSQTPTRTVTIDVATGPKGDTGPAGPPGPKGEPGTSGVESCPQGSTFGKIVVNTPGGHVEFLTCIVD